MVPVYQIASMAKEIDIFLKKKAIEKYHIFTTLIYSARQFVKPVEAATYHLAGNGGRISDDKVFPAEPFQQECIE